MTVPVKAALEPRRSVRTPSIGTTTCGRRDPWRLYTPQMNLREFLSGLLRPRGAKLVCAPFSLNSLDGTFSDDAFDMFDYVICQDQTTSRPSADSRSADPRWRGKS